MLVPVSELIQNPVTVKEARTLAVILGQAILLVARLNDRVKTSENDFSHIIFIGNFNSTLYGYF